VTLSESINNAGVSVLSLSDFIAAFGPGAHRRLSSRSLARAERKNRDNFDPSGASLLREPTVPSANYFASLVMIRLGLSLPLSIMQVYDRLIPNRSLAMLAWLFFGSQRRSLSISRS
jgi:ABC-type bacteriocin/lantibiotic exporter with double-glycine peptidase domain